MKDFSIQTPKRGKIVEHSVKGLRRVSRERSEQKIFATNPLRLASNTFQNIPAIAEWEGNGRDM